MIFNEGAPYGGGAYGGTLYNCTLMGNSVSGLPGKGMSGQGGAVYGATLYNCTLTGNSVWGGQGGGAFGSTLSTARSLETRLRRAAFNSPAAGSLSTYNGTVTGNTATGAGGELLTDLHKCQPHPAPEGKELLIAPHNRTAWATTGGMTEEFWDMVEGHWGALYNCIVYYNTV
jgi:hypothetical protein